MSRLLPILLCNLLVSASAIAQVQQADAGSCSFSAGKALMWSSKDPAIHEAGLSAIRCASESGDLEAQVYLSALLDAGFGVPQDTRQARELLERAAAKHYGPALSRLAFVYLNGVGARVDKEKALALLNEAASLGEPEAMANLGAIYGRGDGVRQNESVAAEWYRKAADRGNAHGQTGMANMLMRGDGVPQDYSACYLYASLAEKSYPPASSVAKQCEARLTSEERERVVQQLQTWKPVSTN